MFLMGGRGLRFGQGRGSGLVVSRSNFGTSRRPLSRFRTIVGAVDLHGRPVTAAAIERKARPLHRLQKVAELRSAYYIDRRRRRASSA